MCCGRNRDQALSNANVQTAVARPQTFASGMAGIPAQYLGTTAMTVLGPVSGKVYRFDRPGAQVDLDRRDLSALAAVPKLKFIR
jgi:hypothetical protein